MFFFKCAQWQGNSEAVKNYVTQDSEEDSQESRGGSGRGIKKCKDLKGTARYLGDLEKALNDFRSLTETYVQTKTGEVVKQVDLSDWLNWMINRFNIFISVII